MNDEPRRIAWAALETGTPVVTAGGDEIGRVSTVVADDQKDIFSGVAFRPGVLDGERFLPADLIDEMTEDAVVARVEADAVDELDPYEG